MHRLRTFIIALASAAALGWASPVESRAQGAEAETLTVIGFIGDARMSIGPDTVQIRPGSQAFIVPPGSEVSVVSGDITFLAQGNVISAKPGDSFRFSLAQDRALVEVVSGRLSVSKEGAQTALGPGDVLTWAAPGAVPTAAPAPEKPVQPSIEPATPPLEDVLPPSVPPPPAPQAEAPEPAPRPAPEVPSVAQPAPPSEEAPGRKYLPSWLKSPGLRLQVELHPYYNLRETYDSNIYLVPPDKPNADIVGGGVLGAWITSNNLGVRAIMPMGKRHKLEAGYDFRALNYSKAKAANDSMEQAVRTDYAYSGRKGVTAHLFNAYANTMDTAFSELTKRERRWQNTAGGRLDVEFSRRLYAFADGQHTVHKYLGSSIGRLLNRYEQSLGGGLGVLLGPKTKAYASYHRSIIHYSAGRKANSKGHSADVGLEGQLTSRLKGKVSVGMHSRRYDDVTGTSITERETTWQTSVDVTYAVSRWTLAGLQAFRGVNEAISGNSRFSETTGIGFNVMQSWRKLTVGVNGSLTGDRFPEILTIGGFTAKRRDNTYSAGVKAQYKVKDWLSTGMDFTRTQKHSNFTRQFNYAVNRTSLEVRVSF